MKEVKAYAKLNLTLDILGKRTDGYHDMRMIMQEISLCDTLTIRPIEEGAIRLRSNLPYLPCDRSNIVSKAAEIFFRETGMEAQGFDVAMEKRIPVCAGMAGGSSDGAAMLCYLRDYLVPSMPREELERIGALVGSDVPFCLRGGTALAEGRGEVLTDLPSMPNCTILICKPDFPISTPELFAQVRAKKLRFHPDTAGAIAALQAGDLGGIAHRLYNVFEDVLPKRYKKVWELKQQMLALDAMGACMTGSGPTVFGIFEEEAVAREAAEEMKKNCSCVHLAQPVI